MANRRHGMRILKRAAICLVLGAVMTVTVAWAVAVTVQPYSASKSGSQTVWSRPSGIGDGWSYWAVRGFGTLGVTRIRAHFDLQGELKDAYLDVRRRDVPSWSGVYRAPPIDTAGPQHMYIEDARGWPMLAVRSQTQVDLHNTGPNRVTIDGGILLDAEAGSDYQRTILPLRAIWSGFIIDTAFFAAIAFVGIFGLGMLRRGRRRRRGACERCGYDLRASVLAARCPECGAPAGKPQG